MEGRQFGEQRHFIVDGREGRGHGGFEQNEEHRPEYRHWEARRGYFRGGRPPHQQWRQRGYERQFDQTHNRGQHFELRQNLRQNKDPKVQEEEKKNQSQEGEERAAVNKGVQEASTAESGGKMNP
jgi:hypothetical protein